MNLITVIVPVYNVEKYLEKCINSILMQTYKNIEIILVDNGSTDSSGIICDEYEKKDNRIRVIHKTNGGPSDARNVGISMANGDYIGFVDSDDYIEKDMFESLLNLCIDNDADISIVSAIEEYNGQQIKKQYSKKIEVFENIEALRELSYNKKIQSYAWNKLYKRYLFKDIKFPAGMCFEDIAIMPLLFEKSKKTVFCDIPKYHYARRDDSITKSKNPKTYKDYLKIIYDKYKYLYNKYDTLKETIAYEFIRNMTWVYRQIVVYNMQELFIEFDMMYQEYKDIIDKYGNKIIDKLDMFDKINLYMILLDRNNSKIAIKQLYNSYKDILNLE